MTKYGQTYNFSASEHVLELEKYCNRKIDTVFVNNTKIPKDIADKYKAENDFAVIDDLGKGNNIVRLDLLAQDEIKKQSGDVVKRSLIRHDSKKFLVV